MSDLDFDDLPPYPHSLVGRLRQLKESGQPITLSISGLAELPIRDGQSFELLLDLVDRLDLIETVRDRLTNPPEEGYLSLEEVKEEIRKRHEVSH